MPHVYINEQDNTSIGSNAVNTNVVFIPGVVSDDNSTMKKGEIRLFKTKRDFLSAVGTGSAKLKTINVINLNAKMAVKLLELGLYVLYFNAGTETEFTQDKAIKFDEVAEAVNWSELKDRGLYQVKFLTTGAASSMSAAEDMMDCAAYRGDCIALIDHEKVIDVAKDETEAQVIHDEFENLIYPDTQSETPTDPNPNAKFAAAFSPWCRCTFDDVDAVLPGSFVYLAAYGKATKSNPNWFAYAGSMRGVPPFVVKPTIKFGDVANGILQGRQFTADGNFNEEYDNIDTLAINPICDIDPFGNIVWGNRTLLWNGDNGLTASSFLNIRNLVCDIKKDLYRASRKFTFEQNDDILWANFKAEISILLDKALSGSGIRGYNVEKLETEVKGRLKAHIKIVPIEPVEDFDLTIEMADSLDVVVENA